MANLEFGGEVLRFVINFCITVAMLSLLTLLGWIMLHPVAFTHSPGDILFILAAIALIFTSIDFLVSRLFSFSANCLFLPISASSIVGFAILVLAARYVPIYVSISPNLWLVLLSGLILGIRLPKSPIRRTIEGYTRSW